MDIKAVLKKYRANPKYAEYSEFAKIVRKQMDDSETKDSEALAAVVARHQAERAAGEDCKITGDAAAAPDVVVGGKNPTDPTSAG